MPNIEKLGRSSIRKSESGADIELGQPIFEQKFEKESIEATCPVIKEAFFEFLKKRANHDVEVASALQMMNNAESLYSSAVAELTSKKGDATVALSMIESARGELQYERSIMEFYELESENSDKNQEIEIERQKNFEKDQHYQEASDVLFSQGEYGVPAKSDFIEWLGETKELIKKLAKDEEKKFLGAEGEENIGKRVFRSKLLTDVPAIERFETGRETTRDYREIIDVIESQLLGERENLSSLLIQYISGSKDKYKQSMLKSLSEIRKIELFLAMAEGERNERIARKQP